MNRTTSTDHPNSSLTTESDSAMTRSSHPRRGRRLVSAVIAGAIVALGFAAPAAAAPTIVDPDATGTLIIHKRLNPEGTLTRADGLEDPAAPGTPLNGIQFSVQQITDIDLTVQAGWEETNDAIAALPTAPAPLGTAVSLTTATNPEGAGTAVFEDLEIGAYYVTETLTPAQIADGITPAAPFIITVPITDPDNLDNWLYTTHVYPKNLQTTPEKTVDDGPDTTYEIGDLIDWTISTAVPSQTTDAYAFKDELVEHLEIPADAADNVAVTLNGTPLVYDADDLPGNDYTIAYDAATDNILTVELTAAGRTKLNAAVGSGVQIALTLTTEVVSLPADGIIENTGAVFPNSGFPLTGPGIVTPPVESKFGEIYILKVIAGTTTGLAGAQFKVFASQADAEAYSADPTANADLPLQAYQNGIGNGSLTETFTTDADGEVSISGLRASNWQDGEELTDSADFQNYWLLEVRAPDGYELLTAPVGPITVLYDNANPTVLPFGEATIENVEKPLLPFTGGTIATWLFYLGGGLILVGGAALLIRARSRARVGDEA